MKVFFFGDSICYGQGISVHKGWIPKISSAFEDNKLIDNFVEVDRKARAFYFPPFEPAYFIIKKKKILYFA